MRGGGVTLRYCTLIAHLQVAGSAFTPLAKDRYDTLTVYCICNDQTSVDVMLVCNGVGDRFKCQNGKEDETSHPQ
jgi:endonuclease YncB( thermonuclease family)